MQTSANKARAAGRVSVPARAWQVLAGRGGLWWRPGDSVAVIADIRAMQLWFDHGLAGLSFVGEVGRRAVCRTQHALVLGSTPFHRAG